MQYSGFAQIYDLLMNDINYSDMADYYCSVFSRYGKNPQLVLDLGCGTGNLTIEMAKRGFEMIGVDNSPEMLAIAQSKAVEQNQDIIFLNQDMEKLKLYGSVQAVISSMDCLNYITSPKKLQKVFNRVDFHLEPGGIFAFDLNSKYKIETILGNNTFTYDTDEIFYVWQNKFNKKTQICQYFLTFFINEEGQYYREDEVHKQRIYTPSELKHLANNANMKITSIFEGFNFNKPHKKSEKIFLILEK